MKLFDNNLHKYQMRAYSEMFVVKYIVFFINIITIILCDKIKYEET